MVISGNTLPVLAKGASDQRRFEPQQPVAPRNRSSSRQTAEYVYRVKVEDDLLNARSSAKGYRQHVHPANLTAINRYIDTEINASFQPQRQGRLLDVFI